MRVLVVAPYRPGHAPSQRYRIEQWMPGLEREGFEFSFRPFVSPGLQKILYAPRHRLAKATRTLSGWLRRVPLALRPGPFDVIFLHREATLLGPPWVERALARRGIPIVYDFDDAIFLPFTSPANPIADRLRFPSKADGICRVAAEVVAGNEWLGAWARERSSRVSVVPSTIDTDVYQRAPQERSADPVIRLGWTGSHSSVRYLELLRPALQQLGQDGRIRLRVVGAPFECDGMVVETVPWRAEHEVADLAAIDIGLMPLPDEEWVKGKCSFKALQYMALGIPTVLSPYGMNREVVVSEQNGLFAATTAEWLTQIRRLAGDAALRKRLGEAGRRTIVERYSTRSQVPRMAEVLRRAAAARVTLGERPASAASAAPPRP